jgi:hypothetical protein
VLVLLAGYKPAPNRWRAPRTQNTNATTSIKHHLRAFGATLWPT